jgi:hypothetical protein
VTISSLPPAPYKGLVPYDEADTPFFFGREREREIISANLLSSRLTLLYGPSGVGKSSVLRAGVVSHLRDVARENAEPGKAGEFVVVLFDSWRDPPLPELLRHVREGLARASGDPRVHDTSGRAWLIVSNVGRSCSTPMS